MSDLEVLFNLAGYPLPPSEGNSSACLAQSLDSVLDEAVEKLHTFTATALPPNVQQVLSLVEAAGSLVDQLLSSMGIHDADQDDNSLDKASYSAGQTTDELLKLASSERARTYDQATRDKYAKSGVAMPDGSFPIPDRGALRDAIDDWGRAGSKPSVKAHIIKRARALGATDMIPPNWQ